MKIAYEKQKEASEKAERAHHEAKKAHTTTVVGQDELTPGKKAAEKPKFKIPELTPVVHPSLKAQKEDKPKEEKVAEKPKTVEKVSSEDKEAAQNLANDGLSDAERWIMSMPDTVLKKEHGSL